MTIAEIVDLVQEVTGVWVNRLPRKGNQKQTYARYLAIVLMEELGYANTAIAAALNISRSHSHDALRAAGALLSDDKEFKKIYKASGERMADMEDKQ